MSEAVEILRYERRSVKRRRRRPYLFRKNSRKDAHYAYEHRQFRTASRRTRGKIPEAEAAAAARRRLRRRARRTGIAQSRRRQPRIYSAARVGWARRADGEPAGAAGPAILSGLLNVGLAPRARSRIATISTNSTYYFFPSWAQRRDLAPSRPLIFEAPSDALSQKNRRGTPRFENGGLPPMRRARLRNIPCAAPDLAFCRGP
jgi:hypothetical protein